MDLRLESMVHGLAGGISLCWAVMISAVTNGAPTWEQRLLTGAFAFIGAFVLLGIVIRYQRTSITDLRNDRIADRELIGELRGQCGLALDRAELCERERATDRAELSRLAQQVATLTLNMREMNPPRP